MKTKYRIMLSFFFSIPSQKPVCKFFSTSPVVENNLHEIKKLILHVFANFVVDAVSVNLKCSIFLSLSISTEKRNTSFVFLWVGLASGTKKLSELKPGEETKPILSLFFPFYDNQSNSFFWFSELFSLMWIIKSSYFVLRTLLGCLSWLFSLKIKVVLRFLLFVLCLF